MSPAARAAFGEPNYLVDAMHAVAPSGIAGLLRTRSATRFTPVFQRGDSIWISAEMAARAEIAARQEAAALVRLESDFLRHYFRLQHVERELQARTRGLRRGASAIVQIERERQRLGRELHTGVGQMLAAIRLQLEIIALQLTTPPAPVQQALSRISTLAGDALEYVRSVSKRLHPPEWQSLPLGAALEQLWEMSGVPQRFEASLRLSPMPVEPDLETKILIYRAAQEALSNLTRHARATRAEINLETHVNHLILTVQDNGVGFDAAALLAAAPHVASGIGLRSIRDQAASLGGRLLVQSGPNGTKLELLVPLRKEQP
jgi:signal transduction histidine kinase